MTPEQQKEFTDAIEARVEDFTIQQLDCLMFDDDWCKYEDRISDAKWVLNQFNKIKNK